MDFNSIAQSFSRKKDQGADIYIDLGTANSIVVSKKGDVIVNEPSVVAYSIDNYGAKKVVAIGTEAKSKIGKTPDRLVASHPLKEGVVADFDTTQAMLKYFIEKAAEPFQFRKPRVVMSLPYGVSDVEIQALKQVGSLAGAREVLLIDEPMAAAIGSDLPIDEPRGNMIIDIGGGTTEIAIISLYGIVHCETVRVGGHTLDHDIAEYIRRKYNLIVGSQSSERLKISIGCAQKPMHDDYAYIRGLDFVSGLPKEIQVSSTEIFEAIGGSIQLIIDASLRALENTPPDLMADLIQEGLVVAGGGALLNGIQERLEDELKLSVRICDDPLLAVARGGARVMADRALLERVQLI